MILVSSGEEEEDLPETSKQPSEKRKRSSSKLPSSKRVRSSTWSSNYEHQKKI